jgi:hypothetical protein
VARFRATATWNILGRNLFCIAGQIVDGTLRKGMLVVLPKEMILGRTVPIEGFEIAIKADMSRELVLTFRYANEQQLQTWRDIKLEEKELEVIEKPDMSGS